MWSEILPHWGNVIKSAISVELRDMDKLIFYNMLSESDMQYTGSIWRQGLKAADKYSWMDFWVFSLKTAATVAVAKNNDEGVESELCSDAACKEISLNSIQPRFLVINTIRPLTYK